MNQPTQSNKWNFLNVMTGLVVGYALAALINSVLFGIPLEEAFLHKKTLRFVTLAVIVFGLIRVLSEPKEVVGK